MLCIDCRERDATVVWAQGTGIYTDVRRESDPEGDETRELSVPALLPDSNENERGPNLCERCAQGRYEAGRPPGAPSWEQFTRRTA